MACCLGQSDTAGGRQAPRPEAASSVLRCGHAREANGQPLCGTHLLQAPSVALVRVAQERRLALLAHVIAHERAPAAPPQCMLAHVLRPRGRSEVSSPPHPRVAPARPPRCQAAGGGDGVGSPQGLQVEARMDCVVLHLCAWVGTGTGLRPIAVRQRCRDVDEGVRPPTEEVRMGLLGVSCRAGTAHQAQCAQLPSPVEGGSARRQHRVVGHPRTVPRPPRAEDARTERDAQRTARLSEPLRLVHGPALAQHHVSAPAVHHALRQVAAELGSRHVYRLPLPREAHGRLLPATHAAPPTQHAGMGGGGMGGHRRGNCAVSPLPESARTTPSAEAVLSLEDDAPPCMADGEQPAPSADEHTEERAIAVAHGPPPEGLLPVDLLGQGSPQADGRHLGGDVGGACGVGTAQCPLGRNGHPT